MEIEQLVKKWFDETVDHLEKHFEQHSHKTELQDTVNASIALVQNYVWAVLKLLDKNQPHQHILPAMALLRCLYQLTSRITWISMGSTDNEQRDRLRRLEKKSLQDQKTLMEKTLKVFEKDKRHNTKEALDQIKKGIRSIEKRIDYLKSCGTEGMPSQPQVLEEVFKQVYSQPREGPDVSKTVRLVGWLNLHKAVHPDYFVLKSSIVNSDDGLLYHGDVNQNIDDLRYQCCVCVHRFLKQIYEFHGFVNFQKIDNDFRELGNVMISR